MSQQTVPIVTSNSKNSRKKLAARRIVIVAKQSNRSFLAFVDYLKLGKLWVEKVPIRRKEGNFA